MAAFALKDGYADFDLSAGVLARYDGTSLNVGELLTEGKGYLIVDDPHDEELLDQYEPLKRVSLSEARKAPAATTTSKKKEE